MRINYKNKEIINTQLNLHDAVFTGFSYDYVNNSIQLEMIESYYKKHFKIVFNNVLGFKMASCDFWTECRRVDCWYANSDDEYTLLAELKNMQGNIVVKDSNDNRIKLISRLDKVEQPIQTTLYIISADSLVVLCEYIDLITITQEQEHKGTVL